MRLELSNQPLLEPVGFFEALTATKSLTFHLACTRFHQGCSTSTNPSSGFESQTRLSSRPARVRRTGPTSSIMSRGNTLVSSNGVPLVEKGRKRPGLRELKRHRLRH